MYTLDLDGAAAIDADVADGTLASRRRARMLLAAARDHGQVAAITACGTGIVVRSDESGEPTVIYTATHLLEFLGY